MRLMVVLAVGVFAVLLVGCSHRQSVPVPRSASTEAVTVDTVTETEEDAILDWVESLETELRQNPRPFTDEEWARIKQLCEDLDPRQKITGLYLLGFAYYDPQRLSEAIQIAKSLLNDPEPNVRASAILTLHDLDAREVAPEIQQLLDEPDEHVREDARFVLQDWGYPVYQTSNETGS
ncbi:HEAT repeat domain-containing protein [Fervidibacter sacchari]|uniref:HEAT repeat protein n=1 Tax=Candidatus Fervidibacter sacchari TaxID=1448929 RepID=A0ABT2EI61_9BACT|nr:HEAT repeat domain-containing protein [Candidatus Fervidibacter sacchari]MCS3917607.1 HEAT repeat protein [Candidatus Fervidibacter sacchari]WKU15441.1 HEAT repeat domain-containing protein [Candidatus Fervidibacter sacchari]